MDHPIRDTDHTVLSYNIPIKSLYLIIEAKKRDATETLLYVHSHTKSLIQIRTPA